MNPRRLLLSWALTAVLPIPALCQTSDFILPHIDFGTIREMAADNALPKMSAAPLAAAPGKAAPALVKLTLASRDIAAASKWGQVPPGMQKTYITAAVETGDPSALKDVELEVAQVKGGDKYAPGKGELKRDPRDPSRWTYLPFEEPKAEKHPQTLRMVIVPKLKGRICGEPVEVSVRPVFMHLSFFHSHNPGEKPHGARDDDYELAWRYAKWKYDIDTSNLSSIKYDKKLTTMGVTNPGAFNVGRNMRLGPTAFNSENVCASVIGHENVHGGQSLITFIGPSKYAEPPAYQWEIDNASRLGNDESYVKECRSFQKWYQGTGPRPD